MTDLLKQIDEGIVRHQKVADDSCSTCRGVDEGDGYATLVDWPCETLKALQGWREAVVKLRDEEERHAQLQSRCFEGFPSVSDGVFDALREAVVEGERLKGLCFRLRAGVRATNKALRERRWQWKSEKLSSIVHDVERVLWAAQKAYGEAAGYSWYRETPDRMRALKAADERALAAEAKLKDAEAQIERLRMDLTNNQWNTEEYLKEHESWGNCKWKTRVEAAEKEVERLQGEKDAYTRSVEDDLFKAEKERDEARARVAEWLECGASPSAVKALLEALAGKVAQARAEERAEVFLELETSDLLQQRLPWVARRVEVARAEGKAEGIEDAAKVAEGYSDSLVPKAIRALSPAKDGDSEPCTHCGVWRSRHALSEVHTFEPAKKEER